MLKFKDGVQIADLDPGLFECVGICNGVYNNQGADCTVIATGDQTIDLQTWHIHDVESTARNLRRALGSGFFVTVENDHIRVGHKAKANGKKK